MTEPRGLLDTSVLIASEHRRPVDQGALPEESAVSVITIGELRAGVLGPGDTNQRARRIDTLQRAQRIRTLVIDESVAAMWAILRARLAETRRRMPVNDSWIAATALAHDLPVVTQDDDFDVLADVSELRIIRV